MISSPGREAALSPVTTLISIAHSWEAFCALPMVPQVQNALGTELHLVTLARAPRRWRQLLPTAGKPVGEAHGELLHAALL